MAGTKEGAAKATATNLAKDPNYFSNIGSRSWQDPERSHETGFALNPELAKIAGRKGGKTNNAQKKNSHEANGVQTKDHNQNEEEWTTPEEIRQLIEPEDLDTSFSQ